MHFLHSVTGTFLIRIVGNSALSRFFTSHHPSNFVSSAEALAQEDSSAEALAQEDSPIILNQHQASSIQHPVSLLNLNIMHTEQQEKAKHLYFQTDLGITEIAEALSIPRRTMHYWIRQNNWDRQKRAASAMPSMLAENTYHIIARLTQHLLSDERAERPVTAGEANTLHKLTLTVNKLKTQATLNEKMEVMAHFIDHINIVSPKLAETLQPVVEDFIRYSASGSTPPAPIATQRRYTPEEEALEARLDAEDEAAWAAEEEAKKAQEQPLSAQRSSSPRVTLRTPDAAVINARRENPSPEDFLAYLRSQDENIRHMHPPTLIPAA